jgi:hypothetical protein
MKLRTLKPAAGPSSVTIREATAAARFVYRDSSTGRLVATKSPGTARESNGKRAGSPVDGRAKKK